jgi:hypothetical protein
MAKTPTVEICWDALHRNREHLNTLWLNHIPVISGTFHPRQIEEELPAPPEELTVSIPSFVRVVGAPFRALLSPAVIPKYLAEHTGTATGKRWYNYRGTLNLAVLFDRIIQLDPDDLVRISEEHNKLLEKTLHEASKAGKATYPLTSIPFKDRTPESDGPATVKVPAYSYDVMESDKTVLVLRRRRPSKEATSPDIH